MRGHRGADRQRVLLAMAAFGGSPVLAMFLVGLRLPFSYNFSLGWLQPVLGIQDIGLWFLLLYLLDLSAIAAALYLLADWPTKKGTA